MKLNTFFVFLLTLFVVAGVSAQSRTVTNAELEKHRQTRLQAERDLKENYARMGFPSPEELELKRLDDQRQLEELASRLAEERIERQRNALMAYQAAAAAEAARERTIVVTGGAGGYYYPGFSGYTYTYGRGRGYGRFPYGGYGGQMWRATPGGVIYEPGARSQHVWSPRPRTSKITVGRRPR